MNPLTAALPLLLATLLLVVTFAWASWLAMADAGWAVLLGALQAGSAWLAWQASGLGRPGGRPAFFAWAGVLGLQIVQACLVCLQPGQGSAEVPQAFTLLAGLWSSVVAAAIRRRALP